MLVGALADANAALDADSLAVAARGGGRWRGHSGGDVCAGSKGEDDACERRPTVDVANSSRCARLEQHAEGLGPIRLDGEMGRGLAAAASASVESPGRQSRQGFAQQASGAGLCQPVQEREDAAARHTGQPEGDLLVRHVVGRRQSQQGSERREVATSSTGMGSRHRARQLVGRRGGFIVG
mgnify:CR=1 FL=1